MAQLLNKRHDLSADRQRFKVSQKYQNFELVALVIKLLNKRHNLSVDNQRFKSSQKYQNFGLVALVASAILFFLVPQTTYSQCTVSYSSDKGIETDVCPGDTLRFIISAGGTTFDFNSGTLPSGWTAGAGFSVGQEPCAAPSLTNDDFYWASTVVAGNTPFIETNDLNVSNGGQIRFDMRYAVDTSNPAPCEGPDEPQEGVTLQYSTDGGGNWVDIRYWDPSPGTVGTWPFTGAWAVLIEDIPPAAHTTSTRFRWIQFSSTGADFDNWGLDNIEVQPALVADWDFGDGGTAIDETEPEYVYDTSGTYTVETTGTLVDGSTCLETISVTVTLPTPSILVQDNSELTPDDGTICDKDTVTLTATGGTSYVWSTGSTSATINEAPSSTSTYEVEATDANGCVASTSATTTVVPLPSLSVTGNTTICAGDSTTLTATGGPPYLWSNGQTTASITVAPSSSTAVEVETTSANQCRAIIRTSLTVSPAPQLSVMPAQTAILAGQSVTLTASASGNIVSLPTVEVPLTDDDISPALPISFPFTFFGNTYTEFYISSNGFITFGPNLNNGCCSGQSIPDAGAFGPENFVAFAWEDLDPGNGGQPAQNLVRYRHFGTAPNRILAVEFFNVDHFSFGNRVTAQVLLYEGSNHIEIHTTDMPSDGGNHTQGIENEDGTLGFATPGRNATNWSASNDFVSFTPTSPTNYTIDQTGAFDPLPMDGGVVAPISYLWNTGAATSTITVNPTVTTTYSVTATNDAGCQSSATASVQVTEPPSATITLSETSENTNDDGIICSGDSVTLTGGGGDTYLWSTGATTDVITVNPITTTSYTLTVANLLGATSTTSITVTVVPSPVLGVSGNTEICIGESTTLTASGGTNYTWNNGASGSTITVAPTTTTTYIVQETANAGCPAAGSVSVTVNPLPSGAITGTTEICIGGSTTLSLSTINTSSLVWSTSETSTTITVAPTSSTTYSVTLTSLAGCQSTLSVSVTVNPLPTPSITGTLVLCIGESTTLTASGGTSYDWSNGVTGSTLTVAPTNSTTYEVLTTDANGCRASASQTVTVNLLPTPAISGTTEICAGESTTLTASGGTSYNWSNGVSSNTLTVTPTQTTSYTVLVTDANGCQAAASQTVTVNPLPTPAITGTTAICTGTSTTLTASGGVSYNWSTGVSNSTLTVAPTQATTYTVLVTDANGCQASASQTLTVNPLPTPAITGTTFICVGESATLSLTGASGTTLWNTGASTTSIVVVPSTTSSYSVSVTDANGCVSGTSATVLVNDLPTPAISGTTTICIGESTTLTASGGVTYLWDDGTTSASLTVTPSQTTSYTVTAINGSSCQSSISRTVTVNPLPVLNINGTTEICAGTSTTLTATGGDTYLWSTGVTGASLSLAPTQTSVYEVTGTLTATGCAATISQTLTVNPLPVASITTTQNRICEGENTTLTASGSSNFSWNTGQTTASITVAPAVATTYEATVTDNIGCQDAASITIIVDPAPTITTNFQDRSGNPDDGTICESDRRSVTIVAGGADSYTWSNGATTPSITVSPSVTTDYTLTGRTAAAGCSASTTARVRVVPVPTVSLPTSPQLCQAPDATFDLTAVVSASGTYTYDWNNGVFLGQTISVPLSATGSNQYAVLVTDQDGCTASNSVTVQVEPTPVVDLGPDITPCSSDFNVTLGALSDLGNLSYAWSTGATTPQIQIADGGSYTLTVTDLSSPAGCTATDEVLVGVLEPPVVGLPEDTTLCAGANFNATLTAYDVTHGFQNIEYNWYETTASGSPLSQDSTYEVNASGTYIVQVVNRDNNCQIFDTVNVITVPKPQFQLIGHNPPVCRAQDTLVIYATNFNNYPVSWTGPSGGITQYFNNTGGDSLEVEVVESGLYTATVTNNESGLTCATTREILVDLGDIPLNIIDDTTFCNGQGDFRLISRDLSQFGSDVSYAWYNINAPGTIISDQPNITVPGGGTYVVAVTDNTRNCTKTDTVRVNVNPTPGAEISGYSGGTCAEQEILRVDATNALGYDVSWSGPGISNMSVDRLQILVTASGTYTLTITDPQSGCSGTDAVFVQLGDYPVVGLNRQARLCQTDTLRLDASDESHLPTYSYLWQNALTGETLSTEPVYLETEHETGTETYVVTVTPPSGCATRDTIQVTFDEKATAAFAPYPETLCLGDEVRITATGGDTYQWNTAETTATITATPDRTGNFDYQVLVRRDSSICPAATAIASVEVLEPPILTVTETDLRLCQDELGTSSAYHFTHTDVRYTWTNTETGFVVGTESDYTFVYDNIRPRPTYEPIAYTVSVRDNATGCALSDTVRVKFDRPPTARILENFPRQICQGDSIRFTATGGETFRWSTGDTTREMTYYAGQLGDQILTVRASLPNNCPPSYDTVFFNVQPAPDVEILGGDTLKACEGGSLTLKATGAPNYVWNNGSRADTLEVTPFGTIQVTVLGRDELGCSDADTIVVALQPTAQLPPEVTVCPDVDSVALNAVSPTPATYRWENGWTDSVFYATQSGTYTVFIASEECQYERSSRVTFLKPVSLRLAADTLVCFRKDELPASSTRRDVHEIRGSALTTNSGEQFYYETFTQRDSIEQLIDQNRVGDKGQFVTEITEAGTYFIRLRSNFGCRYTDSIVVADVCKPVIKLPEAFTPSPKDEVNDFFAPLTSDLTRLQLQVFNRYGNVVYEHILDEKEGWSGYFEEQEGWDGTYNGEPLPAGAYLYTVIWRGHDPQTGEPIRGEDSGMIYLIRSAE